MEIVKEKKHFLLRKIVNKGRIYFKRVNFFRLLRRQLRVNSSNRNPRGIQRGYLLNDDPNSSTAPIVGSSHPAANSALSAEEKAVWRCDHCCVSVSIFVSLIDLHSVPFHKHRLYLRDQKEIIRFVEIVDCITKKKIFFQATA